MRYVRSILRWVVARTRAKTVSPMTVSNVKNHCNRSNVSLTMLIRPKCSLDYSDDDRQNKKFVCCIAMMKHWGLPVVSLLLSVQLPFTWHLRDSHVFHDSRFFHNVWEASLTERRHGRWKFPNSYNKRKAYQNMSSLVWSLCCHCFVICWWRWWRRLKFVTFWCFRWCRVSIVITCIHFLPTWNKHRPVTNTGNAELSTSAKLAHQK